MVRSRFRDFQMRSSKSSSWKRSAYAAVASLSLALLCLGVLRDWNLHARFNLLLHGYVFYELRVPNGTGDFANVGNNQFVSRLVYCDGKCIGFLDPFGQFTPKGSDERPEEAPWRGTIAVYCLMLLCFAIF